MLRTDVSPYLTVINLPGVFHPDICIKLSMYQPLYTRESHNWLRQRVTRDELKKAIQIRSLCAIGHISSHRILRLTNQNKVFKRAV